MAGLGRLLLSAAVLSSNGTAFAIAPLHLRRHDRHASDRPRPFDQGFQERKRMAGAKNEEAARTMHSLNLSPSPNLALQRAGTHKVLGRGRSRVLLEQVMRARVLIRRRAVAELSS